MALDPKDEVSRETKSSPDATASAGDALADRRGIADKVMEIGARFTAPTPKEWRERDWDAELYDERGLPRCEGSDFSATDIEPAC